MNAVPLVLPLVVAAGFGVVGPVVAKRLPPQQATWLLSAGGAVAALSEIAVLSLLAAVLVGQLPDVARVGHWSASTLRAHGPAEIGVEAAALLAALAAGAGVLVIAARRGLAVRAAYRSCRNLPSGELLVVADASAGAIAVPGRPGRIVVAQSLLAALSAAERRALLAHERAHLDHGHHWHLVAVSLAAAANPLLVPLRDAALYATERWADEEATEAVGDRRTVARAVARAALVTQPQPRTAGPYLAAAAHVAPERLRALLIRPPQSQPVLVLLMVAFLFAGVAAAVVAGKEIEHLFELAGRTYRMAEGS